MKINAFVLYVIDIYNGRKRGMLPVSLEEAFDIAEDEWEVTVFFIHLFTPAFISSKIVLHSSMYKTINKNQFQDLSERTREDYRDLAAEYKALGITKISRQEIEGS